MAAFEYYQLHKFTLFCLLIGYVASQDATVRFTVREERPINTLVGSVAVESRLFTNTSNEQFQKLTFQILTLGNKYVDMFNIANDTSLLWTNVVIDREEFSNCIEICQIDFNVAVYEADPTEAPKIIKTIIVIDDYNDNKPEFLFMQQELKVSEATEVGEVIIRESAVDLDGDPRNGVQTYTLLPQTDNFELQTVEAEQLEFVIVLKQKLDRETSSLFKIVVIAEDGGSSIKNTGTLLLDIIVTDDNDNYPEFTKKMYNASIPENVTINSTVLIVEASDLDQGDNARIRYTFSNRVPDRVTEHFTINSTSGELTVSDVIDYDDDKEKEFTFQVLAIDNGSPAKSTGVDVYINIQDVNDNFPQININQPPGGTVLSEHATVDSFVAHLEVIDKDSGNNGMVSCNILDEHFRLDGVGIENNYRIVLDKTLDHDTKPEHNVTIVCQDRGDLPKQSTAHFGVKVSDQNDNPPEFTEDMYTATITENNEKGLTILKVSATDKDSGENGVVRYSLQAESAKLFVINAVTGVIKANTSLDRETHGEEIIFRVLATDGGDPAGVSTGTVVVKVNDLNDNAPIFSANPFKFHVSENQVNNTLVGNISVNDPDKGLNGTFYLRFPTSPDVLEYFKFSESGVVRTVKELDRELIPYHQFYVYAVDYGGQTSSVLITVTVHDENDNDPQVIYPNNEDNIKHVPFSITKGSIILQVNARDYDEGENSQLYYYIENVNATYIFWMNVHTGDLYINNTMHESDIDDVYRFDITVMDGGTPRHNTNTTFYVKVIEGESPIGLIAEDDAKTNLIIIVAIIVSVTLILSLIMITVMIRICMGSRRKGCSTASSDIIMESKEVDPRLLESSSSSTTSSKDSNINSKLKRDFPDGFQETGSMLNTTISSIDKHMEERMYIEKVKEFGYEISKKTDETNSDNSGEMGTRDSGQGGSDLDMNSLSELPVLDVPESPTDHKLQSQSSFPSPRDEYNSYYGNRKDYSRHNNVTDNTTIPSMADNMNANTLVGNFSRTPSKTAERKELSKIRKNPKRVMFSDDIDNSSATTNTLSSVSYSDLDPVVPGSRPPNYNRMHSYDSSGITDLFKSNFDSRGNLRRSVDQLLWNRNNGKQNTLENKSLPILKEKPDIPSKSWLDDYDSHTNNSADGNMKVFSLSKNVPDIANHLPTYRASFPNSSFSVQLTDYPSSPSCTDDTNPSELCV